MDDLDNPALRLSHILSGHDPDSKSPDEMDAAELATYLHAQGVAPSATYPAFNAILGRLRGQQALETAAERRARLISAPTAVAGALFERAQAALAALMQHDAEAAQVYARKFEGASEDDLAGLLEDLLRLQAMGDEGTASPPEQKP
jgi:hypothetical protein